MPKEAPAKKTAPKQAPGIDPEVAAAIADSANFSAGDRGGESDDPGRGADDAHEEEQQQEEVEEREEGGSVLADALRAAQEQEEEEAEREELGGGQEEEEQGEEEEQEEQEEEQQEEEDLDIKGVSSAVSKKIKGFKQEAKQAREELEAAKDELKRLTDLSKEAEKTKADLDSAMQIINAIRLEESPEFKAKFDEPITEKTSAIADAISGDEGLSKRIQAALEIEDEKQFLKEAGKALDSSDELPDFLKATVFGDMRALRKLMRDRDAAVKDASSTGDQIRADLGSMGLRETTALFDAVSAEIDRDPNVAIYRDPKHADQFRFDELVKPLAAEAKKEIEASIKTGKMTPGLIRMIHAGTLSGFYARSMQVSSGSIVRLAKENKELKERIAKLSGTASGKRPPAGGGRAPQKKSSGSAILDAAREIGAA